MKLKDILEFCKGTLIGEADLDTNIVNFSIDSRNIPENGFFIPLKGEKADGHDYIDSAFENGAIGTFTSNDIEKTKGPFGTILLTPVFGSLYDRLGKGATLMIIGSILLTVVHVLFALPILNAWWFAIIIMVILGIAFSLVPSAMWPSVPKIIPMKQLGSAYAIIFYIQNIGLSMVPVLIGSVIQNHSIIETAEGTTYDYTIPMSIFALFGVISVCIATLLKRIDKTEGYNLEEPNIKK